MRIEVDEPYPIPDDPVLAEAAVALRDIDDWGWVVDPNWRLVYNSDQGRLSAAGDGRMAATVIGEHMFGPEHVSVSSEARFSSIGHPDSSRENFLAIGGLMLADMPGGKRKLREVVDLSLRVAVDELSPADATTSCCTITAAGLNVMRDMHMKAVRLRDASGTLRGTLLSGRPGVPMGILAAMAFQRDPGYLQQTFAMSSARRRAAAVLFADLESSAALARRLSTGSYFTLIRRIVWATDQ